MHGQNHIKFWQQSVEEECMACLWTDKYINKFVFRSHFNRCTTSGVTQTYCCTIPQSPACTKHNFEYTNIYLLNHISKSAFNIPRLVVAEITAGSWVSYWGSDRTVRSLPSWFWRSGVNRPWFLFCREGGVVTRSEQCGSQCWALFPMVPFALLLTPPCCPT